MGRISTHLSPSSQDTYPTPVNVSSNVGWDTLLQKISYPNGYILFPVVHWVCIPTRSISMNIEKLRGAFTYNGRVGRLYRCGEKVLGTEKTPGGALLVHFDGRPVLYSRACFALAHGYLPRQVRHRNGRVQDNREANLYDPASKNAPEGLPHSGKYKGVHVVNCQYSGRLRGYRGSTYRNGRRFYTAVAETPEAARDLLVWLGVRLDLEGVQP